MSCLSRISTQSKFLILNGSRVKNYFIAFSLTERRLEKEISCSGLRRDNHRFLSSDLYEWAGKVRAANISKKGTQFTPAEKIES